MPRYSEGIADAYAEAENHKIAGPFRGVIEIFKIIVKAIKNFKGWPGRPTTYFGP